MKSSFVKTAKNIIKYFIISPNVYTKRNKNVILSFKPA